MTRGPDPHRWRHVRTSRLWLDVPLASDLDDLHAIHADPDTWRHYPVGRHVDRDRTGQMLADGLTGWERDGLGVWSVRDAPGGPVVGRAGCSVPPGEPWWNLYYRLAASVHGRGYAAEVAAQAVAAAHDVAPDRPVRAFLLEHNTASRRTAEGAGLQLVWRGRDLAHHDPDAVRLVFLDRPPTGVVLDALDRQFGDRGAS